MYTVMYNALDGYDECTSRGSMILCRALSSQSQCGKFDKFSIISSIFTSENDSGR